MHTHVIVVGPRLAGQLFATFFKCTNVVYVQVYILTFYPVYVQSYIYIYDIWE